MTMKSTSKQPNAKSGNVNATKEMNAKRVVDKTAAQDVVTGAANVTIAEAVGKEAENAHPRIDRKSETRDVPKNG